MTNENNYFTNKTEKAIMKKLIKMALVAAVAAVAGFGVYTNQKTEPMSDLMLANVEALAHYELPEVEITCNQYDYTSPGQCWEEDGDCVRLMQYYRRCRFSGYQYKSCTSICNI